MQPLQAVCPLSHTLSTLSIKKSLFLSFHLKKVLSTQVPPASLLVIPQKHNSAKHKHISELCPRELEALPAFLGEVREKGSHLVREGARRSQRYTFSRGTPVLSHERTRATSAYTSPCFGLCRLV